MLKKAKIAFLLTATLVLQTTLLPRYLADPYQPNLLILFVVYAGLHAPIRWGGPASFLLGLLLDTVSGLYFGLNGFSFLLIFFMLKSLAHRLYTDSRLLMVVATFLATFVNGLSNLLLLFIFSAAGGIYAALLSGLLPQALMNALIASLVAGFMRDPHLEALK